MKLNFNYSGIPISDNKLYVNVIGCPKRFKSKEATEYKAIIKKETERQIIEAGYNSVRMPGMIDCIIEVGSHNWYTKTKTIRRIDVQNMSKALLDSIFEILKSKGIAEDDSQIFNISMFKQEIDPDEDEYTYVILED